MSTLTDRQTFCPSDTDGDGDCDMCSKSKYKHVHISNHATWFYSQFRGRGPDRLTLEQARCIDTMCAAWRVHNIPLVWPGWSSIGMWNDPYVPEVAYKPNEYDIEPKRAVTLGPYWVQFNLMASLSTYDDSRLTELVKAAHKNRCRVEISAGTHLWIDEEGEPNSDGLYVSGASHHLTVMIHARKHEGDLYERHPGVEVFSS